MILFCEAIKKRICAQSPLRTICLKIEILSAYAAILRASPDIFVIDPLPFHGGKLALPYLSRIGRAGQAKARPSAYVWLDGLIQGGDPTLTNISTGRRPLH